MFEVAPASGGRAVSSETAAVRARIKRAGTDVGEAANPASSAGLTASESAVRD